MTDRSADWLKQAEDDLRWAIDSLEREHYAQTCFISQQVAEKALKAPALRRGSILVRGHSALKIAQALKIDGEIETIAKRLDLYYVSTRYPDAFAEGAPFEYFTREQAQEAVGFAKRFQNS